MELILFTFQHDDMLRPDLKSVARFKTGWPDLKWATG